MRTLRKNLDKVGLPPVRAFTAEVRKAARKRLRATELGAALWTRSGQRARSQGTRPPLVLKTIRARISRSEGAFTGGVLLKGFAALIETGGRTSQHTIRAKNAPYLVFRSRSGALVRTRSVSHPGSSIRRRPFVQSEIRRSIPSVERVMRAALNRLFARAVL